ncbi:MAG: hypothetical protein HYX42_01615 [Polaromonas sp.]|nr:hypothetical protein [Polaromonas sp.]
MSSMLCAVAVQVKAQTAENYLCIPDQSTGFRFDTTSNTWQTAQFNVKNSKYLLSKKAAKWQWKEFSKTSSTECSGDFNEYGFLRCDHMERIIVNRDSLRFQIIYPIGYVVSKSVKDQNQDNPSIEIGRCSAL